MGITLVTNLSDVLAGKKVKTGTSRMIRIAANMVSLFESHIANKVYNMHADAEDEMKSIEELRQDMENTTDERKKRSLQRRIDRKEGKVEVLNEKAASYNELLIKPLDLSMTSAEIKDANDEMATVAAPTEIPEIPEPEVDSLEVAPQPEVEESVEAPEMIQSAETVAAPLIDENGNLMTSENGEILYNGVQGEAAEPAVDNVAVNMEPEITEANPVALSEETAQNIDPMNEPVFPEPEVKSAEFNPVEAVMEQSAVPTGVPAEMPSEESVPVEEKVAGLTEEIPEPIDFGTISDDVAPVNSDVEESKDVKTDDWSTFTDVFPDAEMHSEEEKSIDSVEVEQPEKTESIVDEMFNPFYKQESDEKQADVSTEQEEKVEIPEEPISEPEVIENSDELKEDVPETANEPVETEGQNPAQQYEDELSRRLTFVYGDNYKDEIDKEENADRVQRIEEAVSNSVELENKVNEKVAEYKDHLLSEGFEEDSDDMLYLLGSKREIAEHELMYPDAKDDLNELNQNLSNLENERKKDIEATEEKISHGKHAKENVELQMQEETQAIPSLDSELNADASLTVVDENVSDADDMSIVSEENSSNKTIEEQLEEANQRERETQEQIRQLSAEMAELKKLIVNMVQGPEQTISNEEEISGPRL